MSIDCIDISCLIVYTLLKKGTEGSIVLALKIVFCVLVSISVLVLGLFFVIKLLKEIKGK